MKAKCRVFSVETMEKRTWTDFRSKNIITREEMVHRTPAEVEQLACDFISEVGKENLISVSDERGERGRTKNVVVWFWSE